MLEPHLPLSIELALQLCPVIFYRFGIKAVLALWHFYNMQQRRTLAGGIAVLGAAWNRSAPVGLAQSHVLDRF